MSCPPLPPFNWETAVEKVRAIEDSWNSREPVRVALGYTIDSFWRSRVDFLSGRAAIEAFLVRKWLNQTEYRLIEELWAFTNNRNSGTVSLVANIATATAPGTGLTRKRKLGDQSRRAHIATNCQYQ